jgi:hypothetical protein
LLKIRFIVATAAMASLEDVTVVSSAVFWEVSAESSWQILEGLLLTLKKRECPS